MSLYPKMTDQPTEQGILAEYADLNLCGYLYNTSYGAFYYSKEFIQKLNERRATAGEEPVNDFYEGRTDPMAVTLFQEMGSEASSGPCARLSLKWIPQEFLGYIDLKEYDGKECVRVQYSDVKSSILDNFLAGWRQDPAMFPVETLDKNIKRFYKLQERYQAFEKAWWKL